jgi:hypothetical protein
VVQAPTATDSLKRIQPTVAAGTAIAETVSGADSVALATFFKTSSNDALVPVDGTLEIRIASVRQPGGTKQLLVYSPSFAFDGNLDTSRRRSGPTSSSPSPNPS